MENKPETHTAKIEIEFKESQTRHEANKIIEQLLDIDVPESPVKKVESRTLQRGEE